MTVTLSEGMITVSNTFIPSFKKRKKANGKEEKPIADTATGDVAFYTTSKAKSMFHDLSDDDTDDEDSSFVDDEDDYTSYTGGYLTGFKRKREKENIFTRDRPIQSITGADWRPCFNDRMTMFIAGTPGAGKSYLAKQMINLLPSNIDILLFTALEEKDGNFEDLGKERLFKIKMTPDILSKISLSEIRKRVKSNQAILLFDDVDKIRDPKVQNLTFAIMNDALANGRGHEKHDGNGDLHVLCTSHSANDYQKTKYTFENSNYVALFPGTTPPLQMYRMFDKLGLDKELCSKMIKLARAQKIRSIIIHKVVPMYMIYGNRIMLL